MKPRPKVTVEVTGKYSAGGSLKARASEGASRLIDEMIKK